MKNIVAHSLSFPLWSATWKMWYTWWETVWPVSVNLFLFLCPAWALQSLPWIPLHLRKHFCTRIVHWYVYGRRSALSPLQLVHFQILKQLKALINTSFSSSASVPLIPFTAPPLFWGGCHAYQADSLKPLKISSHLERDSDSSENEVYQIK